MEASPDGKLGEKKDSQTQIVPYDRLRTENVMIWCNK